MNMTPARRNLLILFFSAVILVIVFITFPTLVDDTTAAPPPPAKRTFKRGMQLYRSGSNGGSRVPLPDDLFADDAMQVFWGEEARKQTDRDSATNTRVCNALDLDKPWFHDTLDFASIKMVRARKIWEFAVILHSIRTVVDFSRPGVSGIGFGVGNEVLPSAFVKAGASRLVATDMPSSDSAAESWKGTDQLAKSLGPLWRKELVSRERFFKAAEFKAVRMDKLPDDILKEQFDFVWSTSAVEHLGVLEAVGDFLVQTAQLLKPGGIAVHTTEIIVSSLQVKLEIPNTFSLLRVQDIERLSARLAQVDATLTKRDYFAGEDELDKLCDEHPYRYQPHIKLFRDWDYIEVETSFLSRIFKGPTKRQIPLCHTSVVLVILKNNKTSGWFSSK